MPDDILLFERQFNSWYILDIKQIAVRCQCNKILRISSKHFSSFIKQQIRMNDTFYCKDCFYKNIRDPNSSLYQSEYGKEFREKKLKSAKVGYKASKIIWDKYRDPNSELYNTEKAIEFRRKESEKCKKIAERTNK